MANSNRIIMFESRLFTNLQTLQSVLGKANRKCSEMIWIFAMTSLLIKSINCLVTPSLPTTLYYRQNHRHHQVLQQYIHHLYWLFHDWPDLTCLVTEWNDMPSVSAGQPVKHFIELKPKIESSSRTPSYYAQDKHRTENDVTTCLLALYKEHRVPAW